MGLFSCCLSPSAAEPVVEAVPIQQKPPPVTQPVQQQPEPELQAKVESAASAAIVPAAEGRDTDWSKSWSKLNQTETTAVKQTLLKVRQKGSSMRPGQ
jgi:hypothetical protein